MLKLFCDIMKKVTISILLILLVGIISFFLLSKREDKINTMDDLAVSLASQYIKDNNISISDSLFIDLNEINDNNNFNKCYQGSGVLVTNNDNNLSYNSYLKCDDYYTKINNDSNILIGDEILILNIDDEYIEPGYKSLYKVMNYEEEYQNVKYLYYYEIDNDMVINTTKRVLIYTSNKDKYIDGTNNNEYPSITFTGNDKITIYYNSQFNDYLYKANDYYDGDATDKVKIDDNIDTSKIGDYEIKYTVMNHKGNYTIKKRIASVILNEVNYNYDISLSTKELTEKVDIILKINGIGYNYTVLPNGVKSYEKEIIYTVKENNTYKFKLCDINNEVKEVEIKVDNIGKEEIKETIFTTNYKPYDTQMEKVNGSEIASYLYTKGYASSSFNYQIMIDNEKYNYNTNTNVLNYDGESVTCEFYKTGDTEFGKISNTITLLGGSGERKYGPIANSRIPSNSKLNNGSLLITIRKDDNYNLSKHPKMISACTKLGIYLSGNVRNNSIIGYSEGAQAASRTVSYNKVKYDIYVLVNGSAYYTSNKENLISNYEPFKNTEIIMIESKNNNNWNETIILTINNFLKNGIINNKIKLFTNDSELINKFSNRINLTIVDNDWSGHGSGYRIIRESNILSYLSSK